MRVIFPQTPLICKHKSLIMQSSNQESTNQGCHMDFSPLPGDVECQSLGATKGRRTDLGAPLRPDLIRRKLRCSKRSTTQHGQKIWGGPEIGTSEISPLPVG